MKLYVWKNYHKNEKALIFADNKKEAWKTLCKEWDLTTLEEQEDYQYKTSYSIKRGNIINFIY